MCGIWFYLKNSENSQKSNLNYEEFSDLNSVRGPDVKYFNNFDFGSIGFYRLKVNDLSDLGNQPFFGENVIMVCNGEIYNHKDLEKNIILL
jgi:asparagine synthase (glutamine-hydrolysing)